MIIIDITLQITRRLKLAASNQQPAKSDDHPQPELRIVDAKKAPLEPDDGPKGAK